MAASTTLDSPVKLSPSSGASARVRTPVGNPSPDAALPVSDTPAKAQTPRRMTPKKAILLLILLGGAAYGARFGWHWWTDGRFEEVTDDAFFQADKVTLAPKVGGFIADLRVTDNQAVKAGDVIARIDDRDYQVVLLQDQADLDKSRAELDGVGSALVQQKARIVEAQADLANAKAALVFSKQEAERYQDLMVRGAGTIQRQQQTNSDLVMKQSAVNKAVAAADAANQQIDALRSLEGAARAMLRRAEINLEQAKLNIGYTTIMSPIDGVVGDRSVRKGQLVQAGANLLTVVPMGEAIYLVANFKETQVGAMREGQKAEFTIDAFGDHVFHGHIVSFAPGTGSQFALLPPENATGNFTKVVQRVPVKIALDAGDPMLAKLRPGLSAEATVDIRDVPAVAEPKPSGAQQVSRR